MEKEIIYKPTRSEDWFHSWWLQNTPILSFQADTLDTRRLVTTLAEAFPISN